MKTRIFSTILALSLLPFIGCSSEKEGPGETNGEASADSGTSAKAGAASGELRIIPLGGSVTETVYALGYGDKVIATDVSSTWPAEATKLPQVGYQRTLSAENILALNPTLVIASEEAGPPAAIQQLRHAGVEIVVVPADPSISGIRQKIAGVAEALGAKEKGQALIDSLDRTIAGLDTSAGDSSPKVMFIYSRGSGSTFISGGNTPADLMIRLAGGRNAVNGYEGFRPVTAEGVVAAAPDIILVPTKGLEAMGGIDGLLKIPGMAETPAGRSRRIVHMDDLYLLGLGPRTGAAALDLAKELKGTTTAAAKGTETAGTGGSGA